MPPPRLLDINRRNAGRRELYKLMYDNDRFVVIANHKLVNVYHLAKVIWPNEARFRKAIQTKSEKAHDRGELYRLPPMASDIFVDIDDLQQRMTEWCHRDAAAHAQLDEFDFDELRQRIAGAHKRTLQEEADEHEAAANDHMVKRQRLLEQLEGM